MKLRLDEYYYILNDDIDYIEEYMPEYILETVNNYEKEHPNYLNEDDFWKLLDGFYSHISIVDIEYDILAIDLEKSYVRYLAIILIDGKYYSFEYLDSPYLNIEDCVNADKDLIEREPVETKVTKYKCKNQIYTEYTSANLKARQ